MSRCCIALLVLVITLSSCHQEAQKTSAVPSREGRNKPYTGVLNISADLGLESVMRQEVEIFSFVHDSVQVSLNFKTESELLQDFKKATASTIILTRELSDAEVQRFKEDTIYVRQVKEAYDAVALVGHKKFDDTKLDMESLKTIFNPSGNSSTKVVFESKNKSLIKQVLGQLGYSDKVSANVFGLPSQQQVLDYVAANEGVIGFVPFNVLSDTDDEAVKTKLKTVKILSLSAVNDKGEKIRVSANQSDIATGEYPLTRTINAVTRFSYADGLDWLFINFMYQSRGAKILLKAGLIPARIPEREINVNSEGLKSN